jgi:hypothetical protein
MNFVDLLIEADNVTGKNFTGKNNTAVDMITNPPIRNVDMAAEDEWEKNSILAYKMDESPINFGDLLFHDEVMAVIVTDPPISQVDIPTHVEEGIKMASITKVASNESRTASHHCPTARKCNKIYAACTPRHINFKIAVDTSYVHEGTVSDMAKTLTFSENGAVIFQGKYLLKRPMIIGASALDIGNPYCIRQEHDMGCSR